MTWTVDTTDGTITTPSGTEVRSIDGPPWIGDDVKTAALDWFRGLDDPDADDIADLQEALSGRVEIESD